MLWARVACCASIFLYLLLRVPLIEAGQTSRNKIDKKKQDLAAVLRANPADLKIKHQENTLREGDKVRSVIYQKNGGYGFVSFKRRPGVNPTPNDILISIPDLKNFDFYSNDVFGNSVDRLLSEAKQLLLEVSARKGFDLIPSPKLDVTTDPPPSKAPGIGQAVQEALSIWKTEHPHKSLDLWNQRQQLFLEEYFGNNLLLPQALARANKPVDTWAEAISKDPAEATKFHLVSDAPLTVAHAKTLIKNVYRWRGKYQPRSFESVFLTPPFAPPRAKQAIEEALKSEPNERRRAVLTYLQLREWLGTKEALEQMAILGPLLGNASMQSLSSSSLQKYVESYRSYLKTNQVDKFIRFMPIEYRDVTRELSITNSRTRRLPELTNQATQRVKDALGRTLGSAGYPQIPLFWRRQLWFLHFYLHGSTALDALAQANQKVDTEASQLSADARAWDQAHGLGDAPLEESDLPNLMRRIGKFVARSGHDLLAGTLIPEKIITSNVKPLIVAAKNDSGDAFLRYLLLRETISAQDASKLAYGDKPPNPSALGKRLNAFHKARGLGRAALVKYLKELPQSLNKSYQNIGSDPPSPVLQAPDTQLAGRAKRKRTPSVNVEEVKKSVLTQAKETIEGKDYLSLPLWTRRQLQFLANYLGGKNRDEALTLANLTVDKELALLGGNAKALASVHHLQDVPLTKEEAESLVNRMPLLDPSWKDRPYWGLLLPEKLLTPVIVEKIKQVIPNVSGRQKTFLEHLVALHETGDIPKALSIANAGKTADERMSDSTVRRWKRTFGMYLRGGMIDNYLGTLRTHPQGVHKTRRSNGLADEQVAPLSTAERKTIAHAADGRLRGDSKTAFHFWSRRQLLALEKFANGDSFEDAITYANAMVDAEKEHLKKDRTAFERGAPLEDAPLTSADLKELIHKVSVAVRQGGPEFDEQLDNLLDAKLITPATRELIENVYKTKTGQDRLFLEYLLLRTRASPRDARSIANQKAEAPDDKLPDVKVLFNWTTTFRQYRTAGYLEEYLDKMPKSVQTLERMDENQAVRLLLERYLVSEGGISPAQATTLVITGWSTILVGFKTEDGTQYRVRRSVDSKTGQVKLDEITSKAPNERWDEKLKWPKGETLREQITGLGLTADEPVEEVIDHASRQKTQAPPIKKPEGWELSNRQVYTLKSQEKLLHALLLQATGLYTSKQIKNFTNVATKDFTVWKKRVGSPDELSRQMDQAKILIQYNAGKPIDEIAKTLVHFGKHEIMGVVESFEQGKIFPEIRHQHDPYPKDRGDLVAVPQKAFD